MKIYIKSSESGDRSPYYLHLYEGQNNAMNIIFIRDLSRGDDDCLICDWDLSEEEVEEIRRRFYNGDYDASDSMNPDEEWIPFDKLTNQLNAFRSL